MEVEKLYEVELFERLMSTVHFEREYAPVYAFTRNLPSSHDVFHVNHFEKYRAENASTNDVYNSKYMQSTVWISVKTVIYFKLFSDKVS